MCKKKAEKFDNFVSLEEFLDHLHRGDEIEFVFNNFEYWTTLTQEGKRIIYKPYDENSIIEFDNAEDILEHKIDGVKIKDFILKAKILHRLF